MKVKKIIKKLIGRKPGTELTVKENDIFIVEYPKSGITWVSFLVANILYDDEVSFKNIYKLIPQLYTYTAKELDKFPSPRVFKSHEPYTKKYKKVIYLIRDPRDVLVSYYHWHKKFNEGYNEDFEIFANKFIFSEVGDYGKYLDHVNFWHTLKDEDQEILYLKYEDIKLNTIESLVKIKDFLKINISEKKINLAVTNSSFENMKALEKKEYNIAKDFFGKSNSKTSFVRSGKGKEWKGLFTEQIKNSFKEKYNNFLIEFKYEENENW